MTKTIAQLLVTSVLLLSVTPIQQAHAKTMNDVVFDINKFEISGNTLLATSTLDTLLAPFVGKNRDFDTIEQAMAALEAAFHQRGFKLTKIVLPEQELKDGVVHFRLETSTIAKVIISGNQTFDDANIRRSLPALVEGAVPNMDALSASIHFANEHPARIITMKLKSAEDANAVDVTLDVNERSPWRFNVAADNAGYASSGRTNLHVALQHANVWGKDHLVSVQYATSAEKPNQLSIYGGSYHVPLYASRSSLDFYANYSDVDSGTVVSGLLNFGITGKGSIVGVRYNTGLSDAPDSAAKLSLGLDVKKFKSEMLLSGFDLGNETVVRPLSINYLNQWPLSEGVINLSLNAIQNIPGTHGQQDDFAKVRIGASAQFSVLRYTFAYNRSFASELLMRAEVSGQYTRNALIPGEQFGAGGANSVRGFTERVIANDSGASVNAELYSPNFCSNQSQWNCRMLGFYDAAYVRRNMALPGELTSDAISSTGFGWRFILGNKLALQIDYGHVLKESKFGNQDKNRVHARANFSY